MKNNIKPIKVAIADDHVVILQSLSRVLEDTGFFKITGTFADGHALTEGLKKNTQDILLLDYHFPEHTGSELSRYISYHYPEIKIIILTGFDKPGLAAEMLECGCMGYLLKGSATTEIITHAILQVYNGQIYIDGILRNKFIANIRRKQDEVAPLKLTQRELEILKEIAAELSSQEIADKFCISKRTVDNHRTSIMTKSGAKNTAGLIKYALELKLI